ncbi:hypothetical protein EDD15DRAFT_2199495 [Pisolithus albus]|nr:hypothetical protein EDD15DRAFT_2199495 [Pisolithus albus]
MTTICLFNACEPQSGVDMGGYPPQSPGSVANSNTGHARNGEAERSRKKLLTACVPIGNFGRSSSRCSPGYECGLEQRKLDVRTPPSSKANGKSTAQMLKTKPIFLVEVPLVVNVLAVGKKMHSRSVGIVRKAHFLMLLRGTVQPTFSILSRSWAGAAQFMDNGNCSALSSGGIPRASGRSAPSPKPNFDPYDHLASEGSPDDIRNLPVTVTMALRDEHLRAFEQSTSWSPA